MQSRLIDVNTAFITYRREVLNNLKSQNYPMVFGSLFAMNALLPLKYRVHISTVDFEKVVKDKEKLMAICKHCEALTEEHELRPVQVLLSFSVSSITGQQTQKIWTCKDCLKMNELAETHFVQNKLENPSFMKVVPDAPQRHEGLMPRNVWHTMVVAWSLQFLAEIEEQVAEFRDDNWQKSELYEGGDDYDGTAEAEDS